MKIIARFLFGEYKVKIFQENVLPIWITIHTTNASLLHVPECRQVKILLKIANLIVLCTIFFNGTVALLSIWICPFHRWWKLSSTSDVTKCNSTLALHVFQMQYNHTFYQNRVLTELQLFWMSDLELTGYTRQTTWFHFTSKPVSVLFVPVHASVHSITACFPASITMSKCEYLLSFIATLIYFVFIFTCQNI